MSEAGSFDPARDRPSIDARKAEVRRRLSLSGVVEKHVKLSGTAASSKRRGQCPFHGGNSASFALFDAEKGTGGAFCFGCQWRGDVFGFVQAIRGIGFMDALAELEAEAGIAPGGERVEGSGPLRRERNPAAPSKRLRQLIEPIDMARAIWRRARRDDAAAMRYFEGRGVLARVLTAARLAPFRYLAECPVLQWELTERWPRGGLVAPALMAMVRQPLLRGEDGVPHQLDFIPCGLHVTYLDPAGDATMRRRKPWAKPDDPDPWLPKRKMLGPVGGGAILLGDYRADAALYVGEGIETVLSAIGLAEAADRAVGVATLSLDNLQGGPLLWKNRTWPLFDMRPDPARPCFAIPGHRGPVTGLIDSDMSPLRGMRDQRTGAFQGELVVERKGGPIVRRAITGAERATICGELFVKGWRYVTPAPVSAMRAPAGQDFNDVAKARAREVVG